jgi:hypothetical protein
MALNLLDLNDETRRFMLHEIQLDKEDDNFHRSSFLTAHGKDVWAALLEESINHDDSWLEREIQSRRLLEQSYTKRKPNSQ